MFIITAADKNYEWLLNISVAQNKARGYNPYIYDLNQTLGYGSPFLVEKEESRNSTVLEKPLANQMPYKPKLLKKAINQHASKKCIAWFDADAFAIRRFDEIDEMEDFDIGVTLRRPDESLHINRMCNGYINAGVIFIKPSLKLNAFFDRWSQETLISKFNSDQHALNVILFQYSAMLHRNVVCDVEGIRVKLFPTEDYNWYYWPMEPPRTTKIIHLKQKNKPECIETWGRRDWNKLK